MKDLLNETIEALGEEGYKPDQIAAIVNEKGQRITWYGFIQAAANRTADRHWLNDIFIHMQDGSVFYREHGEWASWWKFAPPIPVVKPLENIQEIEAFVWDR